MSAISNVLSNHHRACDELLLVAESAAADARWSECVVQIAAFQAEIERHFEFEEQLLFGAFERATGMTQGPTAVMREEHAQMRELIVQMVTAAAGRNAGDFLAASEMLVVLMQQHNLKEEGVLYPECDASLGADGAAIAEALRAFAVPA